MTIEMSAHSFWILPNNVQVFHGLSMVKKARGAAKRCRHTYLTTEQMISPLRWYSLYPRYRDTGHKEWSCWLSWRVWWTSGWRSSTSPQIFPLWIAIQIPMWNIWIPPLSYPHYQMSPASTQLRNNCKKCAITYKVNQKSTTMWWK